MDTPCDDLDQLSLVSSKVPLEDTGHSKMHLLQWKLERKRKKNNRSHPKFLIKILATLKCTYFSENRKRKERKTLQNRILFYNLSINFMSLSVLSITDKVGQWLHFGFMWFSTPFHGSLVAQFDNATKSHKTGLEYVSKLSKFFSRAVCTHTSTIAAITAQDFPLETCLFHKTG